MVIVSSNRSIHAPHVSILSKILDVSGNVDATRSDLAFWANKDKYSYVYDNANYAEESENNRR